MAERVVVMGASPKPHRYSNRAIRMLRDYGHTVVPVHPRAEEIEGLPVVHGLPAIAGPVDTLTLYVGPERIQPHIEEIVALRPGRVILNPGTEDQHLIARLREAGIPCIEGCTLVMLQTGTYDA